MAIEVSSPLFHPIHPSDDVGTTPDGVEDGRPLRASADFDQVYATQASFVWTSARRLGISEDQVADVVQDVFVVIHRRLAEFDGRSSLKTWVWGILTNVVRERRRRFRRKEGNETADSMSELFAEASAPDEQAAAAQALRIVQAILDQMSEDQRVLIVLSQLEGMSVPEIAAITGENVNTLYARIRAARRHFDEAYERACHVSGRGP